MKNISKRYGGVQALAAIDFDLKQGEVHGLVGQNGSGKSALIKIISGAIQPDEGAYIEINGEPLSAYHAIDSIQRGVEVIYQDLSLFPNLTVAENIGLSRTVAEGNKFIDWKHIQRIAEKAMARIGVKLPLDERVGDIPIADQQLVAICRALTHEVKLVIMDEPTASLTQKEVKALLGVVKDMQAKGIATMFVSHKLDEVLRIAERVTILRDGKKVGVFPGHDLDDDKLTMLMTGQQIRYSPYTAAVKKQSPLLKVQNLSRPGNFKDINFTLYPGEILGITGLLGSGRTELALALFGVNPAAGGEIFVEGRPVKITSIQTAIGLGIAYVPENRLVQGLIMPQSVGHNIVITVLDRLRNQLGLLDSARMGSTMTHSVKELAIKIPSIASPVQTLSGGNQQRVVLAKWLATAPKLLILDEPTIGVDVAAKGAIHDIIRNLAHQGMGIILISDEIPEVYHNCNRIIVMHKGGFMAEFDPRQATADEIQARIDAAE
jgi:simple sugar transport system ATP-binding protein